MMDISKIKIQEDNSEEELKQFISENSEEKKSTKREKVVNAILSSDEGVLLIKRGHFPFRNTWALPGGHIEEGETEENAVIREVKEETGLIIKPNYFGSYEDNFEELGFFAYSSIFSGNHKGEISTDGANEGEILDAKWFKLDELTDLKIGFQHRKIIEEYFGK
jgi:8-oxo-dGTP diphosphatase